MIEDYIEDIQSKGEKAVVSLSGGLDSTILTYLLVEALGKNNVVAVSFDYAQLHDAELKKAEKTVNKLDIKHSVLDISFLRDLVNETSALVQDSDVDMPEIEDILGDPQPITYVPNRNTILTSIVAAYAENLECDLVALGIQNIDAYSYWDTTEEWVEAYNGVLSLNRKAQLELIAPFVNLTKVDELEIGEKLNVPFEDTWTCYSGPDEKGRACGTCPSCSERIESFRKAGIKDPVEYKEE